MVVTVGVYVPAGGTAREMYDVAARRFRLPEWQLVWGAVRTSSAGDLDPEAVEWDIAQIRSDEGWTALVLAGPWSEGSFAVAVVADGAVVVLRTGVGPDGIGEALKDVAPLADQAEGQAGAKRILLPGHGISNADAACTTVGAVVTACRGTAAE
ncbi:hypothetical protein [Thermaerobacter litoralis]